MRAVRADVAWARGFLGSSSVSIFMLDSGIDPHHADTEGRVDATRSLELLGTFDAPAVVDGDTVIVPFTEADTVQKYFPGHEVYTDLFFHGTHTAATVSSNAVRIAGITSGTKLVAVKVCGYINECPFSSILNGVIYAANNGAAPGGNSSFGAPLAAPAGRDVFVWAACTQTSRITHPVDLTGCAALPFFIVGAQGTSMAAPHVAGTAALLVSILGRNPSQIKARIQQSADNLAGNGTSPFYGKGRLNVARAVGAIP